MGHNSEPVKSDRINHLARVPLDDSSDKMRCDNHHPVDDMEPLPEPIAVQVRQECLVFVREFLTLTRVAREIVCSRVMGQGWEEIAKTHGMGTGQAAELQFQRYIQNAKGMRRFFKSVKQGVRDGS